MHFFFTRVKQQISQVTLGVGLCLGLAIACTSQDPAPAPLPPSQKQLLVGKAWILQSFTVDPARARELFGPPITDWYADQEECERDDLLIFMNDGTMLFDEGASRCNGTEIQTLPGQWFFNQDETIITLIQENFLNIALSYDILSISADSLVLQRQLGTTNPSLSRETYVPLSSP